MGLIDNIKKIFKSEPIPDPEPIPEPEPTPEPEIIEPIKRWHGTGENIRDIRKRNYCYRHSQPRKLDIYETDDRIIRGCSECGWYKQI